jgi:hypothetical protein
MKRIIFSVALLLFSFALIAQDKYTISGYLKDVKNGEVLIGATVFANEVKAGTAANVYGFYSLSLPKGEHTIVINYLGYQTITQKISLTGNITMNFELTESTQSLQEVVITAKGPDDNVKKVEMSVNELDIKTIKKIPAFLGEVDVIRSIQLLPGVTTVGEGASGFNVRGGGVDQNLILLDEAPVFNSSHLFGFFSVFNPDAVKDVKLIKGGIPAEYGGRVSSVLDVRMKDGNNKKLQVNGGIGLIFSRLSIEAPINKGKGSFIIAGRRSYLDALVKPFLKGDLKKAQFNFYDLTAKANYTINDKNRLFLSGYIGRDVFGAGFKFNWGNTTGTLRWNHVFGSKLFLNTSLIYSNYDYLLAFGVGNKDDSFEWKSKIITYSIKPEFTFFANTKNMIKFGLQSTYYNFVPGNAVAKSGGSSTNITVPDKYSLESAVYVSNEQKVGTRLLLQYGLRYSNYQYLGKGKEYFYRDTTPGIRKELDHVTSIGTNKVMKTYFNFEPRFAAKVDLTAKSSIKASYTRITQYLHLISNTTASTPLDVWTPSSNNIKPQIADQFALGYFQNFGKNSMYEFSVEVYYKQLQNQIDYINNANLLLNEYLEGDLLSGKGRAYGSEFFLKKAKGKFNGWLSYTLGRTERQVNGINMNKWFPNRFDRLHNINLVSSYDLTERFSLSANFAFATGTPATFPTNRIEVQGYVIPHNSEERRNNYRIPAYHRLDISATLDLKKKEGRKWEGSWVFSVYNVYCHRNAFSVFFRQNPDNPVVTEAVRYTIVNYPIPGVSFNFKF